MLFSRNGSTPFREMFLKQNSKSVINFRYDRKYFQLLRYL